MALVCGAPDKVRGKPVRIMVDNAGSVAIWQKGCTTSFVLSSDLVRAIYEVYVAMECTVDIVKITRCSNKGSEMADALSKSDFLKFLETLRRGQGYQMSQRMASIPKALKDWITNPSTDWRLGEKILRELEVHHNVLDHTV